MQVALFDAVNSEANHAGTRRAAERARDALATTELDARVHAYTML